MPETPLINIPLRPNSDGVSPGCQRCEFVPPPVLGPGLLHLKFPLSHTLGKSRSILIKNGLEFAEDKGLFSLHITTPDVASFIAPLCQELSTPEQEDVRAIFQTDNNKLEIDDFFEVDSLRTFYAKARSSWLLDILQQNRLDTWFQPIVNGNDPSQIFAYECLMRGMDGDKIIFPNQILEVAKGANLLFQLDRAARLAAIRNATRFGLATKIFINFTPTSIYDPRNCLQTTVRAVNESNLSRDQIVFEVIESEHVNDPNHLRDILNFYREQGFLVALDDVGSGYSSLNMISRLRPDFIKLDRELISGAHLDEFKGMVASKIIETAQELNIRTIAEGVETEEEYHWLRERGTDYVQGYYFARPATPPPFLEQVQLAVAA